MDPLFIALIILALLTVILGTMVIWMYTKLRRFLVGFDSDHIADSLDHISNELSELKVSKDQIETYLTQVERRLRKGVRSVHTIRFNPFRGAGAGGNQSFATTLLNEDGDGVIISSLYSRDHVSIFSKPVHNHVAEYELSEEERQSLEQARSDLKLKS